MRMAKIELILLLGMFDRQRLLGMFDRDKNEKKDGTTTGKFPVNVAPSLSEGEVEEEEHMRYHRSHLLLHYVLAFCRYGLVHGVSIILSVI